MPASEKYNSGYSNCYSNFCNRIFDIVKQWIPERGTPDILSRWNSTLKNLDSFLTVPTSLSEHHFERI